MMLAALINVPRGIGYPVLFGFVAAESAGALVPGETSLIVAAALASQGQLSLPLVIAVAAGGAILGDNVGYLIGRKGLRRLIERPGRWAAGRRRLVERGERFFDRHGSAAVFFGRWLPGMRVVTSWLAGADRMPWRRFLLWNALGGIAWATTVGLLAYALGRGASGSLGAIGFLGLGVGVVVWLITRVRPRLHAHGAKPARKPSRQRESRLAARAQEARGSPGRELNRSAHTGQQVLADSGQGGRQMAAGGADADWQKGNPRQWQRHRAERTSPWTWIFFSACALGERFGRRSSKPT
jgi:membrane-associated protein